MVNLSEEDRQEYEKNIGIKNKVIIDFGLKDIVFLCKDDYTLYDYEDDFIFNNISYNSNKTIFYLTNSNNDGYFITPTYIFDNVKTYISLELYKSIDYTGASVYISVSVSDDKVNWTDWETIDVPYLIQQVPPKLYIRFKITIKANNIGIKVYGFKLTYKVNLNIADIDTYTKEKYFSHRFEHYPNWNHSMKTQYGVNDVGWEVEQINDEVNDFAGLGIPFGESYGDDNFKYDTWFRMIFDLGEITNQNDHYFGIYSIYNEIHRLLQSNLNLGEGLYVYANEMDKPHGDETRWHKVTFYNTLIQHNLSTFGFGGECEIEGIGHAEIYASIYVFVRFTNRIENIHFTFYDEDPHPDSEGVDVYIPDNYSYLFWEHSYLKHNPSMNDTYKKKYADIVLIPNNVEIIIDEDIHLNYYWGQNTIKFKTTYPNNEYKQTTNNIISMGNYIQNLTQKGIDKFSLSNIDIVAEVPYENIEYLSKINADNKDKIYANIYFAYTGPTYLFYKGLIETKAKSMYNNNAITFTLYDITKVLQTKYADSLLKDNNNNWLTNKNVYSLVKTMLQRSHLLDTSLVKYTYNDTYGIENLFDYWNEYNSEYKDILKGTDEFYCILSTSGDYYVLNNWQLDEIDNNLRFTESQLLDIKKTDYTYLTAGHIIKPPHYKLNNYEFYYLVFTHNTNNESVIVFVRLDKQNKTFDTFTKTMQEKSNNDGSYIVVETKEYIRNTDHWNNRNNTINIMIAFHGKYTDFTEWGDDSDIVFIHDVVNDLNNNPVPLVYQEKEPIIPFKPYGDYILGFLPSFTDECEVVCEPEIHVDYYNDSWCWYTEGSCHIDFGEDLSAKFLKFDKTITSEVIQYMETDAGCSCSHDGGCGYDTESEAQSAAENWLENHCGGEAEFHVDFIKCIKYKEGILVKANVEIYACEGDSDGSIYFTQSVTPDLYGNKGLNTGYIDADLPEFKNQYTQLNDIPYNFLKPTTDMASITSLKKYNQMNSVLNIQYPAYIALGTNNKIYERKRSAFIIDNTNVFDRKNGYDIISQLAVAGAYFWGVSKGTIFFTDALNEEYFLFDDSNVISINNIALNKSNYGNIIKINGKVWNSSNNNYDSKTFITTFSDTDFIKRYGKIEKSFTLDYVSNQSIAGTIASRIHEKIFPMYIIELEVKYTPQLDILDIVELDITERVACVSKYILSIRHDLINKKTILKIAADNITSHMIYGISTYKNGII